MYCRHSDNLWRMFHLWSTFGYQTLGTLCPWISRLEGIRNGGEPVAATNQARFLLLNPSGQQIWKAFSSVGTKRVCNVSTQRLRGRKVVLLFRWDISYPLFCCPEKWKMLVKHESSLWNTRESLTFNRWVNFSKLIYSKTSTDDSLLWTILPDQSGTVGLSVSIYY